MDDIMQPPAIPDFNPRPPKPKHNCTVMVRNIRPKKKAAFKAWCANRRLTMQEAMQALMDYAVAHPDMTL